MSDARGQDDATPWSQSHTLRRAERVFQVQVQRNLTRNYLAHLVHGMLGQTGFRLINAPTFLPAYIMLLSGGSELTVGLALSLQALGMTLHVGEPSKADFEATHIPGALNVPFQDISAAYRRLDGYGDRIHNFNCPRERGSSSYPFGSSAALKRPATVRPTETGRYRHRLPEQARG